MNYAELALLIAEREGVVSYKIIKHKMVYYTQYATTGLYKTTVDLDNDKVVWVKIKNRPKSVRVNLG